MIGWAETVRTRLVSSIFLMGSMALGLGLAACGAEPVGAAPTDDPIDAGRDAARAPDGAGVEDGGREDGGDGGHGDDGGDASLPPPPDPRAVGGPLTSEDYGDQPFLSPSSLDEVLTGTYSLGREFFVADCGGAARPNLDGLGPFFTPRRASPATRGSPRADALAGARASGCSSGSVASAPARTRRAIRYPAIAPAGGDRRRSRRRRVGGGRRAAFGVASSPRPASATTHASYGPLAAGAPGPRASPQLVGMGLSRWSRRVLLGKIPTIGTATVFRGAPRDSRSTAGAHRSLRLEGRAAVAAGVTSAAFAFDMGITSPLHPPTTAGVAERLQAQPSGGSPEFDAAGIEAVDRFMTYLAVPAARYRTGDPRAELGQALFARAGCARCHRPTLVTGASDIDRALVGQTFYPYTDLLLHDMGAGLADPIGEGDAGPREWRTPPLWGLGLLEAAPGARFLHDGRAATLADAVGWHGGEGEAAARAFAAMSASERDALLDFVRSL